MSMKPASVNSDAWHEAEKYPGVRGKVIKFLKDNKGLIFDVFEICDAIYDTNCEWYKEENRLIDEIGEEEYSNNAEYYRKHVLGERTTSDMLDDEIKIYVLSLLLSQLVESGEVECRGIASSRLEDPGYKEECLVLFFTYAGGR